MTNKEALRTLTGECRITPGSSAVEAAAPVAGTASSPSTGWVLLLGKIMGGCLR
jgi:hypothetical protein